VVYTPYWGAPGVGTGWEDGPGGHTPELGAALDTMEVGILAAPTRWAPSTAYNLGEQVLSPNNDVVSAVAAHTSGASYTAASWRLSGTFALRPWVNPMEATYGAVGDGVANDTTALQAAITAGPVFLPFGKTFLTNQLTLAAGSRVSGPGVLKAVGGMTINTAVLLATGDNVTIDGVTLVGNSAGQGTNSIFAAMAGVATTMKNLVIQNCDFSDFTGSAIRVTPAVTGLRIKNNRVHDMAPIATTQPAIAYWPAFTNASADIQISGNTLNVAQNAISCQGASGGSLTDVVISGNTITLTTTPSIPLELFYATGFAVTGNTISATSATSTLGISTAACVKGTISSNVVLGNTYGVELNGAADTITISGNTLNSCTIGIFADGSTNRITIIGNTIARGSQGIWLAAGTTQNQFLIEGNTIVDCIVRGIEVRSTTNDLIVAANVYIITSTPVLASDSTFIMFNGATTVRCDIRNNYCSVNQTFTGGTTVGCIRILATVTNCTIADNTFVGTGALLANSAISTSAVAVAALRVERNRIINYSQGILTATATNDDVYVIDNVIDSTVTTPYNLKATHLRSTKQRVEMTAAPTVGTWAVGDEIRNSAPAVASPKGWLCTVAGTPGTWVSTGNL
jgi:parallel beta-helix repeat protein